MKEFLIHKPKAGGHTGIKTRDGKYLVNFHLKKVDEFWILQYYGREVLDTLKRKGKWEDRDKEVAIAKIETAKKEAV